jgi:hypothetical protein
VRKTVKNRIREGVNKHINKLNILDEELGPRDTLSKLQCDKLTTQECADILNIVNTQKWGPLMLSLAKLSKRSQQRLLPTLEMHKDSYYKHTTILMEGYVVHNIKEYIKHGAFPGEAGQGYRGGEAITTAAAQEMKFFKKRWYRAFKADNKADSNSKKLEALATLIGIGPGEEGVREDDAKQILYDMDAMDPANESESDDGSSDEEGAAE